MENRIISLGRKHPLFIDENRIVFYKHGSLYSLDIRTKESSLICRVKMPAYKRILSFIRIFERTLRLEPRCVAYISDNRFILSYSGSIYCVDEKTKQCTIEHTYRAGMSNVLQFVSICGIQGFDDTVAYGEYWQNPNREPVSILVRENGLWKTAYTFPENSIKHIHGMIPDPYRNCVYILTGDEEKESGIWVARDNFNKVEPLLIGKKEYRSCIGSAEENGLVFVTDNPFETNYIRFASLTGNAEVTDVNNITEINGPCIYGAVWKDNLVLSTSVEQDYSIKRNRISSIFSRKLGGGTKTADSVVYIGNTRTGFSELARYRKDCWPMGLCALGTVQFPQGMNQDMLCIYPVAVKRFDGRTLIRKD